MIKSYVYFSFSSLFSSGERMGDPLAPMAGLKYGGAEEVAPSMGQRKALKSPSQNDVFDGDTL